MSINWQSDQIVIVLGAGSSVCCGLPTGRGLRDIILSFRTFPVVSGFGGRHPEQVAADQRKLANQLEASSLRTIDEFLSLHPGQLEWAKAAIAAALIPLELAAVRDGRLDNEFLVSLYERVMPEGKPRPNIRIVTFNYDRTVELGFTRLIHGRTGAPIRSAWDAALAAPIQHVYGTLDDPWAFELLRSRYDDESTVSSTSHDFVKAGAGIQVIPAKSDLLLRSREIDDVRAKITNASAVVFVGFGFHPSNLRQLSIDLEHKVWTRVPKRLFATRCGISDNDLRSIQVRLGRHPCRFGGETEKAEVFLRSL